MLLCYNKREMRGFTVIEILISLGIMMVFLSMGVINFPSYRGRISMDRTVQEIVFSLRDAESRALSVEKDPTDPTDDPFTGAFGLHFEKGESEYILFSDDNKTGIYDTLPFPPDLDILKYNIQGSINIVGFFEEVDIGSGFFDELVGTTLDITYLRPFPSVIVSAGETIKEDGQYEIRLRNTENGTEKSVCFWTTGLVSIRDAKCQ
ncbi:Tfp pilus assembly protein FimT/FimU [Patescibacteria group bacterium]